MPGAGGENDPPGSGGRLLRFVLVSIAAANLGQWLLFRLLGLGNPGSIWGDLSAFFHLRTWTDSWLPMMQSVDFFRSHPTLPIYSAPLYDTLIYPLASLLPIWLLKTLGMGDAAMLRLLAVTSSLALAGVAAVCLRMGSTLSGRRGQRLDWLSGAAVVLAVIFCFPLLKGYSLGNAQTFLSFGFALLLMLWSEGHEGAGGMAAALLSMVKPQYALLLVWLLVRRRWRAASAFAVTAGILLGGAVLVFGWRNNADYLHVLAGLSRRAQSHYANQSIFGTLNRMAGNGENLTYTPLLYTPYVPWIYRATVATALLLVGGVLLFPWGRLRGTAGDLGAMGLASVAASPMAWDHHYGIVCGILAWVWFRFGAAQQRRRPWLLGLSALLTMHGWFGLNRLAPLRGWNLLQSYTYLGALLLLGVLMWTARAEARGERDPVP